MASDNDDVREWVNGELSVIEKDLDRLRDGPLSIENAQRQVSLHGQRQFAKDLLKFLDRRGER